MPVINSWENSSDRYRSEDTSQWSDATSNTAERDYADRLQPRARTTQRAAIANTDLSPGATEDTTAPLPDCCGGYSCHGIGPECIGKVWEMDLCVFMCFGAVRAEARSDGSRGVPDREQGLGSSVQALPWAVMCSVLTVLLLLCSCSGSGSISSSRQRT